MKKLILLIGLPRSGKTTTAQALNYPIVNPDSIRLALHGQRYYQEAEPFIWAIALIMVRSLFKAGHNCVVVDATNTTKERRKFWKSKEWKREYLYIETKKETCIQRAKDVNDLEIIPIIERMASNFEPLTKDEIDE